MRICIIGTSNSILRDGWVYGLTVACPDIEIKRFTLGGAPISQMAAALPELAKQGQFDYIIFDTTPNDEAYHYKVGRFDYFEKVYRNVLEYASNFGKLVCLQIPLDKTVFRASDVRECQRRTVEYLGGFNIDLSYLLKEVSRALPQKHCVFHSDSYHIRSSIAKAIGGACGSVLEHNRIEYFPGEKVFDCRFQNTRLVRSDDSQTVEIKTSIVSERFDLLQLGDVVELQKPINCIGFFIDASHCSSFIKLVGRHGSRTIWCFFDADKNKNSMKFVPIPGGHLTDHVVIPNPEEIFEIALHCAHPHAPPYQIAVANFVDYMGDNSELKGNTPSRQGYRDISDDVTRLCLEQIIEDVNQSSAV